MFGLRLKKLGLKVVGTAVAASMICASPALQTMATELEVEEISIESSELEIETETNDVDIESEINDANIEAEINDVDISTEELGEIVTEKEVYGVVYLVDVLDVKGEANDDADTVLSVVSGQTVRIYDVILDDKNTEWVKVSIFDNDVNYFGYIKRQFLAVSDQLFLEWENENHLKEIAVDENGVPLVQAANSSADIATFPDSYQSYLVNLKNAHPNWIFVRMDTGVNFYDAVSNEMGNKSLVHKSLPTYTRNGSYDSNWYYATEGILKYYMDPRNGLTEDRIFQFEQLTYNESYHTQPALEVFLDNTFMNSSQNAPGVNMTYGTIIWATGREKNVSPFHLAARIVQEQGTSGSSPMISGSYPGYEGYYNYFNIKASGRGNEEVIRNGLKYAVSQGWDNAYASIYGGAGFISSSYIARGQDTIYLQKFNVTSYNTFNHQYMQNISAPTTEAASMKKLYAGSNALDNTYVFKIPVYNNMSKIACVYPSESNPNGDIEEPVELPPRPELTPEQKENVAQFVERMYTVVLGRNSDGQGKQEWTDRLVKGEIDGAGIANGFVNSQEFLNKGLSNSDFLDVLYRTFLNREADSVGKDSWIGQLNNGASRNEVLAGFVNSVEFGSICERYGIARGTMEKDGSSIYNPYVRDFVVRNYSKALGRGGDMIGIESWCYVINKKIESPVSVTRKFIWSEEFQNKHLSDEEYVEVMYQTFLNRGSDPGGLQNWVDHLHTDMTRDQILDGFAESQEFRRLVRAYGL